MEIASISGESGSFEAFPGVKGRVLLSGENMMFFLVEVEGSGIVPEHSHPQEQFGICLSGKAELASGGLSRIVEAGTAYRFGPNEKHSVRVLGDEPATFLDVFSPPREDYLRRAGGSGSPIP
ncbi:MAG: cupin domain-containing protein [Candidatus Brockarchaeota archaeon]|nr:cupin domain-containing protein [Candidatus Brockarchaeota archaeon]